MKIQTILKPSDRMIRQTEISKVIAYIIPLKLCTQQLNVASLKLIDGEIFVRSMECHSQFTSITGSLKPATSIASSYGRGAELDHSDHEVYSE